MENCNIYKINWTMDGKIFILNLNSGRGIYNHDMIKGDPLNVALSILKGHEINIDYICGNYLVELIKVS